MEAEIFWESISEHRLIDLIPDAILVMDKDLIIRYMNNDMMKLLELTGDSYKDINCKEVMRCVGDGNHSDCFLFNSMVKGAEVTNVEMPIRTSSGRFLSVTVTTRILTDNSDQVMGVLEIFKNISNIEELVASDNNDVVKSGIIGNSRKIQEVLSIVKSVSKSKSTVLIEGESGTGKELVAQAIHANSPRNAGPFVAVNCAALSDSLLESEMFGHKRGSFTGAYYDKPGKFELADKGSIFLDEIADMTFATQAKLLRVIQEEEFTRVGGSKTIHIDVRIIAATNKDLAKEVNEGRFREDLFYRIRVFPIMLPPLKEREGDISLLIQYFIKKFNHEMNKEIANVSHKAMDVLLAYDYPGNVREMENIVEYAFVCCDGNVIFIEHLPKDMVSENKEMVDSVATSGGTIKNLEKEMIIRLINQSDSNYAEVSGKLGISRTTLWRKIKQYKI